MSDLIDGNSAAPLSAWRWLIDLRDHLAPTVDVIGADGRSLLPAIRGDVADRVRRLVRPPRLPIVDALLREATPGAPMVFAHADGLRVGVMGIVDHVGTQHTLLLAERADAGRDATRRGELSRMASWLARALVSTSSTPLRDWREISVLHQVLQKAVARGSVEAVLSAYVEALAIWADTDARAYLGDHAGRFALVVSLAGASPDDAPRLLHEERVAGLASLHRLSRDDARGMGFTSASDTLLSMIRATGHAPWVIAYAGRLTSEDEDRLALYEGMLRPALLAAAEVEASRLMWVLTQHLVEGPVTPREAAGHALTELERACLCTAAMEIRAGELVVQLGVPLPAPPAAVPWPPFAVQHCALDVAEAQSAGLTLWRPPSRPFTHRETRLGTVGATVLGRWVAQALHRGDLAAELSAPSATQAERRVVRATSGDVSLLVILPEPADTAVEVREMWIRDIRRRLRPDDVIAALDNGDISVLLQAARSAEARAVATRLSRLFAEHAPLALLDGAPIAIASADGDDHAVDG